MTGGDLSALLVDLSGLELGNAILSALGMPERTPVECMITDFALQKGLLNTHVPAGNQGGECARRGLGESAQRNDGS
jgi:hypothetical protein